MINRKVMVKQFIVVTFVSLFFMTQSVHTREIAQDQLSNKQQVQSAQKMQVLPNFVQLAKMTSSAVVNVSTLVKPKDNPLSQYYDSQKIPLPDLFRYFFEQQPQQNKPKNLKPVPRSLGSGLIFSKDGYIITNYHVVKDADEILVRLKDRREYKAQLVGKDEKTDIALLKIKVEGEELPTIKLGDSDKLEIGEWVFAIGSPFGFNYSVTKGIVSALNRSFRNENYIPFIQTDVPINPGNSGGPLINIKGEVIGINSQIYSTSGGYMGVSFAIPIDEVSFVAQQLKAHGKVTRGWLGITFQDVDQALAKSFGLSKPEGALIAEVLPDSPAEKAKFKPGDIILSFNGRKTEFADDLPAIIGRISVNSTVKSMVWRKKALVNLSVKITKKPENENEIASNYHLTQKNNLGIKAQTLNDKLRQSLDLSSRVKGVVIMHIADNSIASEMGLVQNDVIVEFDHKPIENIDQFNQAVKNMNAMQKKKANLDIAVKIIRNGTPIFKALSVPNSNSSNDNDNDNDSGYGSDDEKE